MSAQRKNRTAALVVPYPVETSTGSAHRAFPATTGTEAKVGTSTQTDKKSAGDKGQEKKRPLQRRKSAARQKPVAKRVTRVRAAGKAKTAKKTLPSLRENPQPHLLPSDKISLITSDLETPLMAALAPVLVMPEEEPLDAAPMAAAETASDHADGDEQNTATEDHVLACEAAVLEPVPAAEKPTLLQALALQWTGLVRILMQAWDWAYRKLKSHQVKKRLRICETVSLGDKRFIAVIQVDGEQFLVGGSPSSVSTLAHLEPRRDFSDMLRDRCSQDLSQA